MKVVGINGSPKKNGNTAAMIKAVFEPLEAKSIECELYQLGGTAVQPAVGVKRIRLAAA